MAEEAGHELLSFVTSSPNRFVGGTGSACSSSFAEPARLPEKAKSIAAPQTRRDDEHGGVRNPSLDSHPQEEMSRMPLLLRSSPAQGTGKLTNGKLLCALESPLVSEHHTETATWAATMTLTTV
jgi:hypothetical protein